MSELKEETIEKWMNQCIELGKIAKEKGESPVGSIVVKDGKIIGKGIEQGRTKNDITCHAEIEAVRNAKEKNPTLDLRGSILITTHEPCIMCSYVIRHHRIATVIIGLTVEDIGGVTSNHAILTDNAFTSWGKPPQILTGILKRKCQQLHE